MHPLTLAFKISFLAFFVLNGWNQYTDLKGSTAQFSKDYQSFEKNFKSTFHIALPEFLSWKRISSYGPFICQVLALGQILFSIFAVLGSPSSFVVVGLIYFVKQLIHLNVLNISTKTSLAEAENLSLCVALLSAAIAYRFYYQQEEMVRPTVVLKEGFEESQSPEMTETQKTD